MHETLAPEEHDVDPAAPRKLGLLLGGFFLVIALLPLLNHHPVRDWALALGAAFLLLGIAAPALLALPTRAWMALGGLLAVVVAPVALRVIFFGVFATYGAFLRLFRRNILALGIDRNATTYWIARNQEEQDAAHFQRQF